jgi:hypothetical protein
LRAGHADGGQAAGQQRGGDQEGNRRKRRHASRLSRDKRLVSGWAVGLAIDAPQMGGIAANRSSVVQKRLGLLVRRFHS